MRGSLSDGLKSISVALALVSFGFLLGVSLTFSVIEYLTTLGINISEMPSFSISLQILMLQGVSFGLTALLFIRLGDVGPDFIGIRFPVLRDYAWIVAGITALMAVAVISSVIIVQTDVDVAENKIQKQGSENPEIFLVLIPLAFLIIGPGEELLFRGVIQGSLRSSFGGAGAVVLTSVIFAVAHLAALTGGSVPPIIIVLFVLSLILGISYERTGNLVVPIVIHGGYNATLFLLFYLSFQ